MSVSEILKKIGVLEKRLSLVSTYEGNLQGLYTDKGICLYYYLLGDAYLLLNTVSKGQAVGPEGVSAVERCLDSFKSGVSAAASALDIVDRKYLSQDVPIPYNTIYIVSLSFIQHFVYCSYTPGATHSF